MTLVTTDFSDQERTRMVAAALDLFTERGIEPVTMTDVALALRLPEAVVARYFPDGKPAQLEAATERYVAGFRQQLAQQRQQSANAVEEILQMRRAMGQLPGEMRSLFLHELVTDYPAQWQYLNAVRLAVMRTFLQDNLRWGVAEGLYRADLDLAAQVQQRQQETDTSSFAAPTTQAMAEVLIARYNDLLTRVTTPTGAFVCRRLQEGPPYY